MYSTRQNKVARLLQKEMAHIFQSPDLALGKNAMITVTLVRVSPDLSVARVFLSIFLLGDDNKDQEAKKGIMDSIKSHTKEIRKALGFQIKNQVRAIPELQFMLDDSLDYEENIDKLLSKKK